MLPAPSEKETVGTVIQIPLVGEGSGKAAVRQA